LPLNPKARTFSRARSFWLLAALLMFLLFAASAPSPLYAVYQAKWGFSSTTLTVIYAVYAFGALGALLITGRLSDHLGRRRVVTLGLIVQIAGMVAFVAAQGVEALFVARTLQGVGTGIATGAVSAWLLDLQPPDNRRLGSLVGGIAPVAGLAAGALGSGLLVQYGPDPLHLVFWVLIAVFALGLVAMPVIPDPVSRTPGWLHSMRPEIGMPPAARSLFVASAPSLIAVWAVGGLYLSLGPSLAISLLGSDSRIAGGLVIAALLGAAAVASALAGAADPRLAAIRGSIVLIVGVAITLVAVAVGSIVGLYVGSIIAGLGFGPTFSGILRSLAPVVAPDKRGALFASIYVVVYLSFSVPAIFAGIAVTSFGLRGTTNAYGLVVMALAVLTTIAVSRRPVTSETST
jgi:MFS family permease